MREEDIEIIYKNLHLDFVNKYFKNKKQQQKIHKNHNEWYKTHISSFDYSIYVFEDEENNFVAMTSYEILIDTAKVISDIYINALYNFSKFFFSLFTAFPPNIPEFHDLLLHLLHLTIKRKKEIP